MKKYFRIMALLACTAALCVSALAAGTEAPADHAYVPDPQYDVYWGTVTQQENGKLLVQKPVRLHLRTESCSGCGRTP